MGDEDWKEMLAELGSIYFMTEEERDRATEGLTGSREFTFPFMAAGIGAYAAAYRKDGELARRVWKELLSTIINGESREGFNQLGMRIRATGRLCGRFPGSPPISLRSFA